MKADVATHTSRASLLLSTTIASKKVQLPEMNAHGGCVGSSTTSMVYIVLL